MSAITQLIELDAERAPRVSLHVPAEQHAFDESPAWPTTRLFAWPLMAALLLSVATPTAVRAQTGFERLALVLPAVMAMLVGRTLFEVFGFAVTSRGPLRHFAAALPSAVLAACVMGGASVVIGMPWSPVTAAGTAALGSLALSAAGALRGVEVRVRAAMRRIFLIGSPESRRDLERELERRNDARLVGSTTLSGLCAPVDPQRVVDQVRSTNATALVLDERAMRVTGFVEAAARLNLDGLRVRDLVSYYESEFKKVPLGEISPTWFLFDIGPIHNRVIARIVRRSVETVLATTLLFVTLPALLLAGALIRLTSPGPALYRQRRVGKGGVEFTLLKLRTMRQSSERDAARWAGSETHRITPIGALLRRFRIDELPQLWNVIRGDLALIGPRPEQVPIVARLERELPHYSSRHCIRPGLTGWAQVNLGYGGSAEGTVAKLQRDLYYVKHQSLRLDLAIVWRTIRAVLAARG